MPEHDRRRSPRFPYRGAVLMVWDAGYRRTKYVRAKILELSEGGVRIEISEPLPVDAQVSLRAERFDLFGAVTVKHSVRCGSKYMLGLEFSNKLRGQATELMHAAAAEECVDIII